MHVHKYSFLFVHLQSCLVVVVKVQNSNITIWHEMQCTHTEVRARTLSTFYFRVK